MQGGGNRLGTTSDANRLPGKMRQTVLPGKIRQTWVALASKVDTKRVIRRRNRRKTPQMAAEYSRHAVCCAYPSNRRANGDRGDPGKDSIPRVHIGNPGLRIHALRLS